MATEHLQEIAGLRRALVVSKNALDRALADAEAMRHIHEDFKEHHERLRRDLEEMTGKFRRVSEEKRDTEAQFEATIRSFKAAIEAKQREIEEVQSKALPPIDIDMLRLRLLNEIEGPHRVEMEEKESELEKANAAAFEARRQMEQLVTKAEGERLEFEQEIRELKERHRLDIDNLVLGLNTAPKEDDGNLREEVRTLRREAEDLRRRLDDKNGEMERLYAERAVLKEERNDVLLKWSRQLEAERSEKRTLRVEAERCTFKARQCEEDARREAKRAEEGEARWCQIQTDLDESKAGLREKDALVSRLLSQLKEFEEEQFGREANAREEAQRLVHDVNARYQAERSRSQHLQGEADSLRRDLSESEASRKDLQMRLGKEKEAMDKQFELLREDRDNVKRHFQLMQKDYERLRSGFDTQGREAPMLQRENDELKRRVGDLIRSVETLEEETKRLNEQLKEAKAQNPEVEALQKRNQRLKAKLNQANEKIMELLTRKMLAPKLAAKSTDGTTGLLSTEGTALWKERSGAKMSTWGKENTRTNRPPSHEREDYRETQRRGSASKPSFARPAIRIEDEEDLDQEVARVAEVTQRLLGKRLNY